MSFNPKTDFQKFIFTLSLKLRKKQNFQSINLIDHFKQGLK